MRDGRKSNGSGSIHTLKAVKAPFHDPESEAMAIEKQIELWRQQVSLPETTLAVKLKLSTLIAEAGKQVVNLRLRGMK